MKSVFFAVLFPMLILSGLLMVFSLGLAGPGSAPKFPLWLQIPGWMVMTPVRPSRTFPTGNGFANLFITIGVNSLLWSYVLSLLISLAISGIIKLMHHGRSTA